MADHPQKAAPRPLSPFLTIYRWPITMVTSFAHRVTGVGLAGGMLLIAWWLIATAYGPESFHFFNEVVASPLGQLVMFGFVWALAFHLLNGIRHLAWNFGYGFAVPISNQMSVLVITMSVFLAIAVFVLAYTGMGGYYQ